MRDKMGFVVGCEINLSHISTMSFFRFRPGGCPVRLILIFIVLFVSRGSAYPLPETRPGDFGSELFPDTTAETVVALPWIGGGAGAEPVMTGMYSDLLAKLNTGEPAESLLFYGGCSPVPIGLGIHPVLPEIAEAAEVNRKAGVIAIPYESVCGISCEVKETDIPELAVAGLFGTTGLAGLLIWQLRKRNT